MKVRRLIEDPAFELVTGRDLDREIKDFYSGDLLSWVMSHAKENNAWCTVLTHVNIVAVSALLNLSCIIICEDAEIELATIEKAKKENVNVVKTSLNTVEVIQKMISYG